ncbi:MAG: ParA family protein [Planctomycetota bacterium]|jgi:chromosome partitioning protein
MTPTDGYARLAIASHKGGVGKTTTTACLAAGLGAAGYRVLVVDLDPQATLSTWLGVEPSDALAKAFTEGAFPQPLPATGFEGFVEVLPGGVELFAAEHGIIRGEIEPHALGQLLGLHGGYNVVLIDTHPGTHPGQLGLIGAAIEASQRLLVVTDPSGPGLDGAQATADLVEARDGELLGAVLCRYDARTAWARELLAAARRVFGDALIEPPLRQSVRLTEAPTLRTSPLIHARGERVAGDIVALADAVAARLGLASESTPNPSL